jgi:hypothetical protein
MSAIQPITDARLVAAIERAKRRVVMIAPGVWPPVAAAVAEAWRRLGQAGVTVILDIDPEICRIGYGSLEGLTILQAAAAAARESIRQEPGVRICVFMVDDETFVFSPTPRQLEAAPGDNAAGAATQPKANGIVLGKAPAALESALGSGPEGDVTRTLGLERLPESKIKSVVQDLRENPPKAFDLSRAVSVYNAKIQFVELKVTGCRLSEHTARLPQHLLHVLKKNPALSQKIQNSIRLLDDADELVNAPQLSQETIFKKRDALSEKYLRSVKGVGTVMERSKKAEFVAEVVGLKAEVTSFAKQVKGKLDASFRKMAEDIAGEVLDDVLADVPQKWRKRLGASRDPERVRWLIIEDLLAAFGDPATKVRRMTVETVFKDVTYEMLREPEFRDEVARYFPDLTLLVEFSAAKERSAADQATLFS